MLLVESLEILAGIDRHQKGFAIEEFIDILCIISFRSEKAGRIQGIKILRRADETEKVLIVEHFLCAGLIFLEEVISGRGREEGGNAFLHEIIQVGFAIRKCRDIGCCIFLGLLSEIKKLILVLWTGEVVLIEQIEIDAIAIDKSRRGKGIDSAIGCGKEALDITTVFCQGFRIGKIIEMIFRRIQVAAAVRDDQIIVQKVVTKLIGEFI